MLENNDEIAKIVEHIYCELHILKLLTVNKDNDRIICLIDELQADIDRLVFELLDKILDETSIEALIHKTKQKMEYAAGEALKFLSRKGYKLNADIYLLFFSLPAIFSIQKNAGNDERTIYKILCDFVDKYKS